MRAQSIPFFALLSAGLALAGCSPDEATDAGAACATGETRAAIVTALGFTRTTEAGQAPGFDLDNRVSDGSDIASCGKKDFTDPDGRAGVDNQLAALVPEVEKLVGNAVDGLVQGAINDGQLVILMEMGGVDDFQNDSCVSLAVQVGEKRPPSLGTDGVIEAYQTFELDASAERSYVEGARIENGVLETGPFGLAVPLALFDVSFTLHLHDARFRFSIDDEGMMQGHLGGGIVPQEILDGVSQGAGTEDLIPQIRVVLESSADLALDEETGKCQEVSSALQFEAAPAFIRR
ncbi:hypothetical protein [Polyangium aurulentum]|uniref:hypothetical protein n=1 Tax=Polyangium aurulentum TaxID=2567896 RepID=UPI0010AE3277|nr:hypothetical protein [Polyangium aurulentum]UQA59652.1 hypothetical protein E8A73_003865 [Polyangium aurulentum]